MASQIYLWCKSLSCYLWILHRRTQHLFAWVWWKRNTVRWKLNVQQLRWVSFPCFQGEEYMRNVGGTIWVIPPVIIMGDRWVWCLGLESAYFHNSNLPASSVNHGLYTGWRLLNLFLTKLSWWCLIVIVNWSVVQKKNDFYLQSQGLIKGSVPKNKREKKKDTHQIKFEKKCAYMFVCFSCFGGCFSVCLFFPFFLLLHFLAIKLWLFREYLSIFSISSEMLSH